MVKMVFRASSRSFSCSSLCRLPTARSLCTLEKRLAPSHEQTHQRYKPGTSKGGTVLMNPNSKSQTETGSRYQKYFLNKCNDLFATGNVCEVAGAAQHAEDGRYLPVPCNWMPPLAPNQLSRCCRRQLILMEQSNFFKQNHFLAIVSFCSIISP